MPSGTASLACFALPWYVGAPYLTAINPDDPMPMVETLLLRLWGAFPVKPNSNNAAKASSLGLLAPSGYCPLCELRVLEASIALACCHLNCWVRSHQHMLVITPAQSAGLVPCGGGPVCDAAAQNWHPQVTSPAAGTTPELPPGPPARRAAVARRLPGDRSATYPPPRAQAHRGHISNYVHNHGSLDPFPAAAGRLSLRGCR